MDGSNSITITKFLRKGGIKAYNQFTKYYGLEADLYKLKTQNNPASDLNSFYDDLQNYEDKPYLSRKVLIPSIFRRRSTTNLSMLDPFIDSDIYMYIPADVKIYLHTLVVVRTLSNKLINYRVSEIHEINNDAGLIVGRYTLVPVISIDIEKNKEELLEIIKREEQAGDQKDNYSTTESEGTDNSEFIYSEIK